MIQSKAAAASAAIREVGLALFERYELLEASSPSLPDKMDLRSMIARCAVLQRHMEEIEAYLERREL